MTIFSKWSFPRARRTASLFGARRWITIALFGLVVAWPVIAAAQEPCPGVLRLDVDGPNSDIDPGWTGIAFDNHYVGLTLTMGISGCAGSTQPSCGACTLSGPVANGGGAIFNNRRCADKSWITCTTTSDCTAQSAAGPCEIFFGPPLPYSAGGISVCVTNEITAAGSGAINVEAGTMSMHLPYLAKIYTGLTPTQPCPQCNAGLCNSGPRNGLPCTTNGNSPFFGNVSFDCPPTTGSLVGSLAPTGLDLSTGASGITLSAASPTCNGAPGKKCACASCSLNSSVACKSDADCSAASAGTCTSSAGQPREPNACFDDTSTGIDGSLCDDVAPVGDGEGRCPDGPVDQHCAIETFRGCLGPSDCPAAGDSCTSEQRKCFMDNGVIGGTVSANGVVDPPVDNVANPVLAGVFCIPPTTASSVNSVGGFPGPGRVHLPGTLGLGDEIASGTVGAGGTVTTDTEADGATPSDPLETSVTTPNAGEVIINEQATGATPPSGFEFLGKQVNITAPAASVGSPLVLVFRIDASRIPAGEDETTISVFKDGTVIGACTGAGAVPNPCVAARALLGDGDVQLTVRTATASLWNFGTGAATALDHFTCYQAGASKGSIKFPGIDNPPGISLLDQFWGTTAAVKRPKYLCAPTDKNGEDPAAPTHPDHLEGYPHKPAVKFTKVTNQRIVDQFGELFVDVLKPSHVLVPTAKSLVSTPPAPVNPAVDHFQCYKLKDLKTPQFQPTNVTIQDQFGSMAVLVKKPKFLCAPVNKNNEAPGADAHIGHLMCYQVKQLSTPKFAAQTNLFVDNQFGPETLDAKKPTELCVPAAKNFTACDDAIVIPPGGGTISGSTTGLHAGVSTLTGSCGGGGTGAEQVYQWTPALSGVATVTTCGAGTNYDTVVYVRAGTCDDPSAQIACDDDSSCGFPSRVFPTVTAGQTYFIVVDGFGGHEGDFALTVTPPSKRVFVTSTTTSGNMGNLTGADAICQTRASVTSLPGTYKAWLSNVSTSAASRLTQSTLDYVLVDGTVVANGWSDLTDGTLDNPINKDEFGSTVNAAVWTNCTTNGSIDAAECLQWTSTLAGHKGQTGLSSSATSTWTHDIPFEDCVQLRHLYCFEQ